ncbi:peptidase M56 [Flavonifractor plautii]|jgi:antirepressor regulating drug resistance, predicted signal transduction N-terminal membrane component|uniref:Peptidase M56 n=1 Tax=Flavonifractor plautii TaxID=292800 RepID=A0A6I2RJF4_FLAPL|nr:M56 family metallopeptidase [Flavonifractor plautii]MDB7924753.1 M56 family metallopeptidase [Flavonifractor plautii]MDC0818226.1 M56 family metallopeptidase [Flavonifractor plautii]MSB05386.1 peptidase M56 [Flavonifractor plautii]MSB09580.1 peptidase M56 [Flavonifractor plautii]MSB50965.1 peptidase M56 [Flavonifractor plautii]
MNELFLKIVNMSISASWLVLVVLILRFVLKKAPKWVNILLWGIVAIRLICPFSFESALSLIPSAETFPEKVISGPSFDVQTGITPVDNRINDYLGDRYFEGVTVPANNGNNIMTILTIVWTIGILLLVAYTVISYWRLRRKVDTAVRYKDNIFQSENVKSPFVLGIIKPRIYLPFNMNGQDLEHVVAHEQAHIHCKDHWWKPFGFLLLTIHWFNPLVWLAYVLLCRDIELACDERVIKELGNEQRADYTQALVACSVNRRMIAACPLAFGEVGVKDRVKSVMNYKKPAFWGVVLAVIVCVFVAVCFLTNPVTKNNGTDGTVTEWFDYLETPDEMVWDGRLEINLPEFPGVTFRWYPEKMEAVTEEGIVPLFHGMPIWNTYFCDLTGDRIPDLCSTYTFGSGIIDSRIIIYDYANGASYELSDRGYFDFTLRFNEADGYLYVDKTKYNTDELVETGRLVFKNNSIQIEGFSNEAHQVFRAEILEIHDGHYLVKPVEGSWELNSADRIVVPISNAHPSPEPEIGDVIEIEYSGEILETYPARIADVYGIKVIKQTETWDLIPMVMVNGTLYLDTGHESKIEARCGVMDGEITSQVDGNKQPSVDNQSNFGTGYGYQYGATEGTIELFMNGKWWIFATEEARQKIQFPSIEDEISKFYLTIGSEGVKSIKLSMPNSSGGFENADGSLLKKGERIWLENLDGYTDLRGLTITALGENGEIIWTASIPDEEENKGFTHLVNDDWEITNIE